MKWNRKKGEFQESKRGTSNAREFYFITTLDTGGKGWLAGYYSFGNLVVMYSAGIFKTAQEARAYCEKKDNETLVIEEMRA